MCFLWDQEDAAEGAMGKGLCHQVGSKVAATSPCLAASKAWFLAPAAVAPWWKWYNYNLNLN